MYKSIALTLAFIAAPLASQVQAATTNCDHILTDRAHITQPGVYCLRNSITRSYRSSRYNPRELDSWMFIIDADNVTLDLNGHTLRNTDYKMSGVQIRGSNVQVKNGTLETTKEGIVVGKYRQTLSNVHIDRVRIVDPQVLGIDFKQSYSGYVVQDAFITNSSVHQPGQRNAISVGKVNRLRIQDNTFTSLTGTASKAPTKAAIRISSASAGVHIANNSFTGTRLHDQQNGGWIYKGVGVFTDAMSYSSRRVTVSDNNFMSLDLGVFAGDYYTKLERNISAGVETAWLGNPDVNNGGNLF